jgi:hypothetical protein
MKSNRKPLLGVMLSLDTLYGDKSKMNRFFLEYFPSANPRGLTLYFLNGGIL